jgi:hypothetical protein
MTFRIVCFIGFPSVSSKEEELPGLIEVYVLKILDRGADGSLNDGSLMVKSDTLIIHHIRECSLSGEWILTSF